jgi:hypothetical protein
VTPDIHSLSGCFLGQEFIKRLFNKSDCNQPMGHHWATPFKVDKSNSSIYISIFVPQNLTNFRLPSPCQMTRIRAFRRNCLQLAYTQSWRIPKWLIQILLCPNRQAAHHSYTTCSSSKQTWKVAGLNQLNKNSV